MTTKTNPLTTATALTKDIYCTTATGVADIVEEYAKWTRKDTDYGCFIKKEPKVICSPKVAKVKKVIFNNPATIIFWDDKTKTVVKCQEGDTYDKEKGFVMAYLKKMLGNKNEFNKEIHKWVKEESK